MNEQRIYGAIGLARKAGKCIAGDFAVERALKAGKVCFILLDADVSAATHKRYCMLCERQKVEWILLAGMGHAIGKPGNRIAAITDENFAGMIRAAIKMPVHDTENMKKPI